MTQVQEDQAVFSPSDFIDTEAHEAIQHLGDWRDMGAPMMPHIEEVALKLFVKKGYHAASIRTIAADANLSVPGVYHHYPSKQALLNEVMKTSMRELWIRTLAALEEAPNNPVDQLAAYIEVMVLFHTSRRDQAFVALYEMRSLEPEHLTGHIAARDRQHKVLVDILQAGVQAGEFEISHVGITATSIITVCTGIAQWYRPDGDLSPQELYPQILSVAERAVGRPMAP